jgi:hypothetical protein
MSKLHVPKKALQVVRYYALGYRHHEITAFTGIGRDTQKFYLDELRAAFGALSTAHLIATMISLGALDPRDFVPALTQGHEHGNDNHGKRQRMQRDRPSRVQASIGESGASA